MKEKDLLIESRFRNAILYRLMEGKSNAEICRLIGIEQTRFGALLNLKMSPIGKQGEYLKVCVDIANYFHMLPDQVFPRELYALQLPDRVLHEFSSDEVPLFAAVEQYKMIGNPEVEIYKKEKTNAVDSALSMLPQRVAQILQMRYGLNGNEPMLLEDIAKHFNLTPERIRQIETKGLRKLRHPTRNQLLKPFLEEK